MAWVVNIPQMGGNVAHGGAFRGSNKIIVCNLVVLMS